MQQPPDALICALCSFAPPQQRRRLTAVASAPCIDPGRGGGGGGRGRRRERRRVCAGGGGLLRGPAAVRREHEAMWACRAEEGCWGRECGTTGGTGPRGLQWRGWAPRLRAPRARPIGGLFRCSTVAEPLASIGGGRERRKGGGRESTTTEILDSVKGLTQRCNSATGPHTKQTKPQSQQRAPPGRSTES